MENMSSPYLTVYRGRDRVVLVLDAGYFVGRRFKIGRWGLMQFGGLVYRLPRRHQLPSRSLLLFAGISVEGFLGRGLGWG